MSEGIIGPPRRPMNSYQSIVDIVVLLVLDKMPNLGPVDIGIYA